MALFFVDEGVLYKKLECIVCPMKLDKLFMEREMYGKIAAVCGADNLYEAYCKARINKPNKAWLCSGLNMANHMIQIVITSFVEDPQFESTIFNAYLDLIKVIIENNFKSVVVPYLPYSYKRLGNMYSYKTCKTLLCYFMNRYRVDCNIYILVERQVMQDHLDGYVSSYVSTSYPLSKRHTPRKYPLVNESKLVYYLEFHGEIVYEQLIANKDFNIVAKGKFKCIYELIIEKYDDARFCFLANLDKQRYIDIFSGNILPSKYEALAIALVLGLSLKNVVKMLDVIQETFVDNIHDNIILSYVGQKYVDIFFINERLYMLGLIQLGSYKPADKY